MNLGIFLAPGDSFINMKKSGQDIRFKRYYLEAYSKNFEKVFIFSYANEETTGLPKNVVVIPNRLNAHRYFYALLIPFLNYKLIRKCDIFRCFHISSTPPAIISKLLFGKKFVFNYAYDYESFSKNENKTFQRILFKMIEPLSVNFASKIFAANKIIYKMLPANKTVYLPNGVDVNSFRRITVKKPSKRPTILSVGRLEKQKNFSVLINALAGLKTNLIIVGNGSLKEEMISLAKRLRVSLKIIESVPNDKMPQIYNKADIFILTSIEEGSPKVLLEAMACELPVLATNSEGVKEIIKHGKEGILVDNDFRSINKSLVIIIKEKNFMVALGSRAREKVIKEFNLRELMNKEIAAVKI